MKKLGILIALVVVCSVPLFCFQKTIQREFDDSALPKDVVMFTPGTGKVIIWIVPGTFSTVIKGKEQGSFWGQNELTQKKVPKDMLGPGIPARDTNALIVGYRWSGALSGAARKEAGINFARVFVLVNQRYPDAINVVYGHSHARQVALHASNYIEGYQFYLVTSGSPIVDIKRNPKVIKEHIHFYSMGDFVQIAGRVETGHLGLRNTLESTLDEIGRRIEPPGEIPVRNIALRYGVQWPTHPGLHDVTFGTQWLTLIKTINEQYPTIHNLVASIDPSGSVGLIFVAPLQELQAEGKTMKDIAQLPLPDQQWVKAEIKNGITPLERKYEEKAKIGFSREYKQSIDDIPSMRKRVNVFFNTIKDLINAGIRIVKETMDDVQAAFLVRLDIFKKDWNDLWGKVIKKSPNSDFKKTSEQIEQIGGTVFDKFATSEDSRQIIQAVENMDTTEKALSDVEKGINKGDVGTVEV